MKIKQIGKLFVLAAIILAGTACHKDEEGTIDKGAIGTWHLISHEAITSADADIYLDLSQDGNFSLYQRTGDMIKYDLFTGTYNYKENRLSGTYSDDSVWASSYNVSIDGSYMTMEATGSKEKSIWEKCAKLPNLEISQRTRSYETPLLPIL